MRGSSNFGRGDLPPTLQEPAFFFSIGSEMHVPTEVAEIIVGLCAPWYGNLVTVSKSFYTAITRRQEYEILFKLGRDPSFQEFMYYECPGVYPGRYRTVRHIFNVHTCGERGLVGYPDCLVAKRYLRHRVTPLDYDFGIHGHTCTDRDPSEWKLVFSAPICSLLRHPLKDIARSGCTNSIQAGIALAMLHGATAEDILRECPDAWNVIARGNVLHVLPIINDAIYYLRLRPKVKQMLRILRFLAVPDYSLIREFFLVPRKTRPYMRVVAHVARVYQGPKIVLKPTLETRSDLAAVQLMGGFSPRIRADNDHLTQELSLVCESTREYKYYLRVAGHKVEDWHRGRIILNHYGAGNRRKGNLITRDLLRDLHLASVVLGSIRHRPDYCLILQELTKDLVCNGGLETFIAGMCGIWELPV